MRYRLSEYGIGEVVYRHLFRQINAARYQNTKLDDKFAKAWVIARAGVSIRARRYEG